MFFLILYFLQHFRCNFLVKCPRDIEEDYQIHALIPRTVLCIIAFIHVPFEFIVHSDSNIRCYMHYAANKASLKRQTICTLTVYHIH
jgi:hypothetical protein